MGELQEGSQDSKDLASVTATCEAVLLLLKKFAGINCEDALVCRL